MPEEPATDAIDRRRFITLSAAASASLLSAATLLEPAMGQGAPPTLITAKPLPERIFTTEVAGISRKTHEEHYELYKGYVAKVNEIRTKLSALGAPDTAKANATYSDLRELKVEYSFALGGVKHLDGAREHESDRRLQLRHDPHPLVVADDGAPLDATEMVHADAQTLPRGAGRETGEVRVELSEQSNAPSVTSSLLENGLYDEVVVLARDRAGRADSIDPRGHIL